MDALCSISNPFYNKFERIFSSDKIKPEKKFLPSSRSETESNKVFLLASSPSFEAVYPTVEPLRRERERERRSNELSIHAALINFRGGPKKLEVGWQA